VQHALGESLVELLVGAVEGEGVVPLPFPPACREDRLAVTAAGRQDRRPEHPRVSRLHPLIGILAAQEVQALPHDLRRPVAEVDQAHAAGFARDHARVEVDRLIISHAQAPDRRQAEPLDEIEHFAHPLTGIG